jgi:membrane protein DedA with SNARE-associated domain
MDYWIGRWIGRWIERKIGPFFIGLDAKILRPYK